MNLAPSL